MSQFEVVLLGVIIIKSAYFIFLHEIYKFHEMHNYRIIIAYYCLFDPEIITYFNIIVECCSSVMIILL